MLYFSIKTQANVRLGSKQHGLAVLAMLAVIISIFTAAVIGRFSINKLHILKQQRQMITLVDVKDAILGHALQQTSPGQLPCPDFDGDGIEDRLTTNACRTELGFIPYVTLNLNQPLDASLTPLWLAVNLSYALPSVNPMDPSSVVVDGTTYVAAVILAPGAPFESQIRATTNNANAFVRFFEGTNGNTNKAQYAREQSDTNNDELIFIGVDEYRRVICKVRTDC